MTVPQSAAGISIRGLLGRPQRSATPHRELERVSRVSSAPKGSLPLRDSVAARLVLMCRIRTGSTATLKTLLSASLRAVAPWFALVVLRRLARCSVIASSACSRRPVRIPRGTLPALPQ